MKLLSKSGIPDPKIFFGIYSIVCDERQRQNWLSNRNNISRERTKSFWGDDLAPWRHQSPPPKKEKAETTQTIIMNWSLERSVHILHLHLFFSLSPLDVLSFIDVLQVFLLLEFSLGVNHKKKLWRKKSNKIRQSTCGQTPLYMDIGSGFFIFEKKKRRWSLDWQDVNDLCLDSWNYDWWNTK